MERDTFLIESMRGTLAFARLGILLVFLMNALGYMGAPYKAFAAGMALAALSAGLSYAAQSAASLAAVAGIGDDRSVQEKACGVLQVLALAAAIVSGLCFVIGA